MADSYRAAQTLELPSEPLKVVMSPGGTRLAAVYASSARRTAVGLSPRRYAFSESVTAAKVCSICSGEELASLPLEPSALSDVVFLDENRLIFAGEEAVTAWDLSGGRNRSRVRRASSGSAKRSLAATFWHRPWKEIVFTCVPGGRL